jgi:hypothetical protein
VLEIGKKHSFTPHTKIDSIVVHLIKDVIIWWAIEPGRALAEHVDITGFTFDTAYNIKQ